MARQRLELQNASLQDSLRLSEVSVAEREEACRRELDTMRQKLDQSDRRQEEMSDCVSEATRPLLRQIESLQASMREVRGVGEKVEQSLGERLQLASQSLALAQERERGLQDRLQDLGLKEATSEEKVRLERERRLEVEAAVEEMKEKLRCLEDRSVKDRQQSEVERKSASEEVGELQRERDFLTASLATEKAESEGRKRKCLNLLEQLKDRDRRVKELQAEVDAGGRASVASMGRSVSASPCPSITSDTSWYPGGGDEVRPPQSPQFHHVKLRCFRCFTVAAWPRVSLPPPLPSTTRPGSARAAPRCWRVSGRSSSRRRASWPSSRGCWGTRAGSGRT